MQTVTWWEGDKEDEFQCSRRRSYHARLDREANEAVDHPLGVTEARLSYSVQLLEFEISL